MVRYLRLLAGSVVLFGFAVPLLVFSRACNAGTHVLIGATHWLVQLAYAIRGKPCPPYIGRARMPSSREMALHLAMLNSVAAAAVWLWATIHWDIDLMLASALIAITGTLIAYAGRLMK